MACTKMYGHVQKCMASTKMHTAPVWATCLGYCNYLACQTLLAQNQSHHGLGLAAEKFFNGNPQPAERLNARCLHAYGREINSILMKGDLSGLKRVDKAQKYPTPSKGMSIIGNNLGGWVGGKKINETRHRAMFGRH